MDIRDLPSTMRAEGSEQILDQRIPFPDQFEKFGAKTPADVKIFFWMTVVVVVATYTVVSLFMRYPPEESSSVKVVNTTSKIAALIEQLHSLPRTTGKPNIYCDIEGVNLSRHGSVSILSIYVLPINTVYLVDIHKLKSRAFTSMIGGKITLRNILEDPKITKVFFDVRNDSDALYSHFGINLAGIHDLQLMELGARWGGTEARKYVRGLAKAIVRDSSLSPEEKIRCSQIKEYGNKLFAPAKGGDLQVFNQRPLRKEIVDYCAVDVKVLPSLWDAYNTTLQLPVKKDWRKRVAKATLERIRESQSKDYNPIGVHKTLGPWYVHYPESDRTSGK